MVDLREYLSVEYWRAHSLELAYGVAGFVLFLAFLFATFPYTDALEGALAPAGLRFTSSDQGFALPVGAKLSNVRIVSTVQPGAPAVFESSVVKLRPAWGWLLLLRPGVSAHADAYGGTLSLAAHKSGNGAVLSLDADSVNLAMIHVFRSLGATLGGQLTGYTSLAIYPGSPTDDSGTMRFTATGFTVRLGETMPPLRLGNVEGKLKLDNGVIQVDQVKGSGGDVAIDGHGTIKLAQDWHDSQLALSFSLTPSTEARQRLAFLLNFLPHPPGPAPYRLNGTIASPVLT